MAPAQLDVLQQRMWVADDVRDVDGWQVRRSRGVTKRANSVLPHGTPLDVPMAIALVEQLYRQQGLAPCFQVTASTLPADLDATLADRGYERLDETRVLVADLSELGERLGPPRRPVVAVGSPDAAYAALAYRGERAPAAMAEIGRRTPSVYASVREEGRCVGAARGALVDGWLGLFELVTDDAHRRQGVATTVVSELVRRAASAGAKGVLAQVLADNDQAGHLFASWGFAEAGRYHYRRKA